MTRLFSLRKTTMIFVIRDKTRTLMENLEPVLRKDIQKVLIDGKYVKVCIGDVLVMRWKYIGS
ncbi:hypothetical protein Hdeb2414_s0003g00100301 [Helianthus debilis subsp. tardiflorus]